MRGLKSLLGIFLALSLLSGTAVMADEAVNNKTCTTQIPGQAAGSLVQYRIEAYDVFKNKLTTSGNYTVKQQLTVNITALKDTVRLGENITITGVLSPKASDSRVSMEFSSSNSTQSVSCIVSGNGTFVASFAPDSSGLWAVMATSAETQTAYSSSSEQLVITVTEPPIYVKYSLYIIIGLVAVSVVGGVVYYLRFRGR